MVKPLITYPQKLSNAMLISEVRNFNDDILDVIQDMKDTMSEHNLTALSAVQINHLYTIIVMKEAEEYKTYINPRILSNSEPFDSTENTIYYPNVEVTIPRYGHIKVIYEDVNGEAKHTDITDPKVAVDFQRKLDYLYGGDILLKVSQSRREEILNALKTDGLIPDASLEVCPTITKKDYILSFNDKLLFFMGLSLLTPLFSFEASTVANIWLYDKIALLLVIGLMVGYFVMAQIEAKEFKQCTSCQVGNQLGIIAKRVAIAIIFSIAGYFLLN